MKALSFFSREDPVEREVYEKLKEELLKSASEEDLKNLSKLVFAMIKPAAFARGLAPDVINWLKAHGFKIALESLKKLTGKELDELYMFVKRKYFESWWIMERAYSMAPAIAMVLVGEHENYEHACAKLRDLIGPTTPEAGSKGKLRYDLKGVNRVFNIIHISDDPAAAIRESLVFFDLNEVLEALSSGSEANLATRKLIPDSLLMTSRWETFSKLKSRCNQFLNSTELQELLEAESKIISMDLPFDEERSKLAPIESKISNLAANICKEVSSEGINRAREKLSLKEKSIWDSLNDKILAARCVELLSDEIKLMDEKNFDLIMLWMISRGIIFDEWEEIIVHSTWAVMPQVIRDLRKYHKIIVSSQV